MPSKDLIFMIKEDVMSASAGCAGPKQENNAVLSFKFYVLSFLHFSKFRVRIKVELKL